MKLKNDPMDKTLLREIDKEIRKAIQIFNEKGYETQFCCAGHLPSKGDGWVPGSGYIMFVTARPAGSLPKGVVDEKDYPHWRETRDDPRIVRWITEDPKELAEIQKGLGLAKGLP